MKKLLSLFFFSMVLQHPAIASQQSDIIPIASCQQLQEISDLSATYRLTQDIDCGDMFFKPIEGEFSGILDGLNDETGEVYTISRLNIVALGQMGEDSSAGIFRKISGAGNSAPKTAIKNIKFTDAMVSGSNLGHRGLLAGQIMAAKLENIWVDGLMVRGEYIDETDVAFHSGGLTGVAKTAVFQNIHLENLAIAAISSAGGIAGHTGSDVYISDSSVKAMSAEACYYNSYCPVGGFIGEISEMLMPYYSLLIENSMIEDFSVENNAINLVGISHVGGVVGRIVDASGVQIKGVSVNGITGDIHEELGGLVGTLWNSDVDISYSQVHNFSGVIDNFLGGLVGGVWEGSSLTISHSSVDTFTGTTGLDLGGLIGAVVLSDVQIEDSFTRGVTGSAHTRSAGGLIGAVVQANVEIDRVYTEAKKNDGVLWASEFSGGLVGYVDFSQLNIRNAYSQGIHIAADRYAGGLLGYVNNQTPIQMSYVYTTNFIDLGDNKGGRAVVGYNDKLPKRVHTYEGYFDKTSSNKKHSGDEGSKGFNTTEMFKASRYVLWDKNIWDIKEGSYPRLIGLIE